MFIEKSKTENHTIYKLMGIKIKIKQKRNLKNYLNSIENNQKEILKEIKRIQRKLSMPEEIWQFRNIKFYCPCYPSDFIQKHIVDNSQFFEEEELKILDEYIPKNPIIFDIGANIGNHTLYWTLASSKPAQKVYAFEPVPETFFILEKNVKLNNLEKIVKLFNFGLYDKTTNANFLSYNPENIGDTHLAVGGGGLLLQRLDDMNIVESHVDFIKIDVEDCEVNVLKGAENTIKKYKPIIFIESLPAYINETKTILESFNYELVKSFEHSNYLFKPKK